MLEIHHLIIQTNLTDWWPVTKITTTCPITPAAINLSSSYTDRFEIAYLIRIVLIKLFPLFIFFGIKQLSILFKLDYRHICDINNRKLRIKNTEVSRTRARKQMYTFLIFILDLAIMDNIPKKKSHLIQPAYTSLTCPGLVEDFCGLDNLKLP